MEEEEDGNPGKDVDEDGDPGMNGEEAKYKNYPAKEIVKGK